MSILTEDLPVTIHHKLYAGVNLARFENFMPRKVVLITNAQDSVGQAAAINFARTGAALFLLAPDVQSLDAVQATIHEQIGGARVMAVAADLKSEEQVGQAIEACVQRYGHLDVVVNTAGSKDIVGKRVAQSEPSEWWHTWEENVKGAFHVAHFAIPHLIKSKGYLVFLATPGALIKIPGASSAGTAMHALGRFTEYCHLEYGQIGVKTFYLHSGTTAAIETSMFGPRPPNGTADAVDHVHLPAAMLVRLIAESPTWDWYSGRQLSWQYDLDEMLQLKETIVGEDSMKSRLSIPAL